MLHPAKRQYATPFLSAICPSIAVGTIALNHLAQLVFLGKLATQNLKLVDEILGGFDDCVLWSKGTIGLNAKLDLGEERMGNCMV